MSYHIPDDNAFNNAYQQHAQEEEKRKSGKSKFRFLNFLGPNGAKWNTAQVGFTSTLQVILLPASMEQAQKGFPMHFVPKHTHFFKSHQNPRGTSVPCNGKEDCFVCAGRNLLFESSNQADFDRAQKNGRVRNTFVYQVFDLGNIEGHTTEDGKFAPFLIEMGTQLHSAVMELCNQHKLSTFLNPQNARPLILTKKKTGPESMNVVYMASPALESLALPRPEILENLVDLSVFNKRATVEEQIHALDALRFPHPQGVEAALMNEKAQAGQPAQAQQTAAYNPAPNPPQPPPPSYNPNPVQQVQTQVGPPPQTTTVPQQAQPVQYAPQPAQTAYVQPQSSGQPVVATQAPVTQTQAQAVQQYAPEGTPLNLPLAPEILLPEGRQRCFGKFAESDRVCQDCPAWIKNQCVPQSQATGLDDLQKQMTA